MTGKEYIQQPDQIRSLLKSFRLKLDDKELSAIAIICEEYADLKVKEAYVAKLLSKEDFQSLITNSLRQFTEEEISTDVALDLGSILYDNLKEIIPTYEQWKQSNQEK